MERYRNSSSGIRAYHIGSDYILVKFGSFKVYKYSYAIAGKSMVDRMKILAKKGRGLNSFINRHAKYCYD